MASTAREQSDVAIGVIVVNWNNAADTLHCLESLHAACPRPTRVVVVDNGSSDGSAARCGEWASQRALCFEEVDVDGELSRETGGQPWLTIVNSGENFGFAGGNNLGLSLLQSEATLTHFLLLNNDAIVAPDYFAEMSAVLQSMPHAGLCIGTIFELPNRERVWYAGGRMVPLRALVAHGVSIPTGADVVPTEFVTGCAMVIAREALQRVGMLAECYYPGYMEDAEYSLRVRQSGLALIYAPRAIVYHKVGTTFGARAMSTLTAYHQSRHRLFFVRRNLRGTTRIAATVYMLLTKPIRAFLDALRGRPDIGWATLRGTIAGLFGALDGAATPHMPTRRRESGVLAGDGAPR